MSLGQIIRSSREERNLTLDEVAAKISYSKPYLSTIETDKTKNPPSDKCLNKLEQILEFESGLLQHIAHLERMPADIKAKYEYLENQNRLLREAVRHLMDNGGDSSQIKELLSRIDFDIDSHKQALSAGHLIPVFNKVTTVYPAEFDEKGFPVGTPYEYVRCPGVHDPNAFGITVVGYFMTNDFNEGDIVVFSPKAVVKSGDDCFVHFKKSHENTFKRVFFGDDGQVRLQPLNQEYPPLIVDGKQIVGVYKAIVTLKMLNGGNSSK